MKVKKAIKKIAAIGAGVTMVGATLMGAVAQNDLGNYPNMFLDNGRFNGYLVIGANADTIDTFGVVNIATGLQAEAVTRTTVCGAGSTSSSSVTDGVKIDETGAHMNYGESIFDVKVQLDDTDLPDLLADGKYQESVGVKKNNEDYTQVLNFVDNTSTFVFYQDDNNGADDAASYLFFDKVNAKPAYQYVLEFNNPVDFDTTDSAADLETTSISIQGQDYTIIDASFTGANVLEKLTLMSGDAVYWISQDETITRTIGGVEHEITMIDVTASENTCGLNVDGTTVWIDIGQTQRISGLTIGVTDAKAVHNVNYDQDICKVYLGAEEIVLQDGQRVEVAGEEIDGSEVTLSSASELSSAGLWTGITVTYTPADKLYLLPGEELVDPVFGNFKFVFGGVSKTTEEVSVKTSGDRGSFVFTNPDGKKVTLPMFHDTGNEVFFGEGAGIEDKLYHAGTGGSIVCNSTSSPLDVADCEGSLWLVVKSKKAHVLRLRDVDVNNDHVDFEDVTYGIIDTDNSYTNGASSVVQVSGLGAISVIVNEAAGTISLTDMGSPLTMETEFGGRFTAFDETGDNISIIFGENTRSSADVLSTVQFDVFFDSGTDDAIEILTPTFTGQTYGCASNPWVAGGSGCQLTDDNNDDLRWATRYGSVIAYDSENDDEIIITHPNDWVSADVFIAPVGAEVTQTETEDGCVVTEKVNMIPDTVNKFDSDITNPRAFNIISVGGPCANSVTSALMGNPEVCYEGFEEGRAILQLVESGDKVALIVAGGTGRDTLLASKLMQNHANYALSGMRMVATTVSENQLSVSSVA